jgi:hypothetical protein
MGWLATPGFSSVPTHTSGFCSGGNAVSIAALHGAQNIVLLGFDMKDNGHWHEHYINRTDRASVGNSVTDKFIPWMQAMSGPLADRGIKVYNACPTSALTCWPRVTFQQAVEAIHG